MYTKGGWKAGKSKDSGLWHIHGGLSSGKYICCLPDHNENEANAHLIAAAPELYEALKDIRKTLEALGYQDNSYSMGVVDKALSKAEGK